jgi:hypothetical protein
VMITKFKFLVSGFPRQASKSCKPFMTGMATSVKTML